MKYLPLAYASAFIGLATANHVVVSLGSSYAAGAGLAQSYGSILADYLKSYDGAATQYVQGAVSGSQLTDVPGQATKILKNTTIVTLTSGGNDLNYASCLSNPSQAVCSGLAINSSTFTTRFNNALDSIINNMKAAGVGCPTCVPIYVVTYPQALGSDTICASGNVNCTLTSTQVTQDKYIYNSFTNWTISAYNNYQANQSSYNLHLLDMRPLSAKHDVGSQNPWVNGKNSQALSNNGLDWHPNKAGVTFIASAIYANNKNQPTPTP